MNRLIKAIEKRAGHAGPSSQPSCTLRKGPTTTWVHMSETTGGGTFNFLPSLRMALLHLPFLHGHLHIWCRGPNTGVPNEVELMTVER